MNTTHLDTHKRVHAHSHKAIITAERKLTEALLQL